MRRALFAAAWAAAIVAIAFVLGRSRAPAEPLSRAAIHAELFHVVMHTLLYGVLAVALARVVWQSDGAVALRARALPAAAVFVGVAVLQEGVQALATGHRVGGEEAYDLAVDVLAAAAGLGLWARAREPRARAVAHALSWLLHPAFVAPLGLFAVYWSSSRDARAAAAWSGLAVAAALPVAALWLAGVRYGRFSDLDLTVRRERPLFLMFGVAWAGAHLAAALALGAPEVVLTMAWCGLLGAAAVGLATVAGLKVSGHVGVAVALAVALAATSHRGPYLFTMAAALLTWARVRDRCHTPWEVAGAWALATSVAMMMFHVK